MKPEVIARLLPAVYQRAMPDASADSADSVFFAALSVMEAMHESTEAFLADRERFIDPLRAEPRFVAAVGRWLGLGDYLDASDGPAVPVAEIRELTRRAAFLARSRGTAESIITICELVTGLKGFTIEENVHGEDGRRIPYHVRLVAPAEARGRRRALERIVASEKPCFVTAEIEFRGLVGEDHDELSDR